MSDHELSILSTNLGTRFRGFCRCNQWHSPWSDSLEAVEALHEAHVELTGPLLPNFSETP